MTILGMLVGIYLVITSIIATRSEILKRKERRKIATNWDGEFASQFMLPKELLWKGSKDKTYLLRMQRTSEFVVENWKLQKPVADMGDENPLKHFIENDLLERIDTITGDFDVDETSKGNESKYGTILDFEVLEHLMNPLTHLLEMKKMLKPGGVIFMSTPNRPKMFWGLYHFHEIDDKNIMKLFDRAGLEVVKRKNLILRGPWYRHVFGIRPIIRFFTHSRLFLLRAM